MMPIFDGIEKLINEHGSAVILKERIDLAKDQYALLEKKYSDAQVQLEKFESHNQNLKAENAQLKQQVKNLESSISHSGNPQGYHCDHCGSQNLKRTGNRPDPMFVEFGMKNAVFCCNECGKESVYSQENL